MLKQCSAARAVTQHNLKTNVHPMRRPVADGQGSRLRGLPVCLQQPASEGPRFHRHPPACAEPSPGPAQICMVKRMPRDYEQARSS